MARFKSKLNNMIRNGAVLLRKSLRKSKRKRKPSPPMHGKSIDILHDKVNISKLIKTHITKEHLEKMQMSEREFMDAVLETERRLGGQVATVNQCVGTFLEVVGPYHPDVKEVRSLLRDMNVDIAVQGVTNKKKSWMRAGTPRDDGLGNFIGHDVDLHWLDDKLEVGIAKKIDELETGYKNGKINSDEYLKQFDNLIQQRINNLDRSKIIEVRDLLIDGSKYSDRAILLRAKDGKWLVLLTEEYKAPASGGVNAQTSIRDTRLFYEGLNPDSKLSFHPVYSEQGSRFYEPSGYDTPATIDIRNLYLNTETTTSDRLATKARRSSNQTNFELRALKVTRSVKERKAQFGEKVRKGQLSDTVFYFVGLPYPGDGIRNLFQSLWNQLP